MPTPDAPSLIRRILGLASLEVIVRLVLVLMAVIATSVIERQSHGSMPAGLAGAANSARDGDAVVAVLEELAEGVRVGLTIEQLQARLTRVNAQLGSPIRDLSLLDLLAKLGRAKE